MRFGLKSKVRVFVGAHNGYLAAKGEVLPDRAQAVVTTLDEAVKSCAMIAGVMGIEFELVKPGEPGYD